MWWCMGCGMSVAVFGALWRAQSSAQKEVAPAHVLEVYLQLEDGPLKLCSLPSSTTVAEVQRIFMGIRRGRQIYKIKTITGFQTLPVFKSPRT
jgi:hypothetical protein